MNKILLFFCLIFSCLYSLAFDKKRIEAAIQNSDHNKVFKWVYDSVQKYNSTQEDNNYFLKLAEEKLSKISKSVPNIPTLREIAAIENDALREKTKNKTCCIYGRLDDLSHDMDDIFNPMLLFGHVSPIFLPLSQLPLFIKSSDKVHFCTGSLFASLGIFFGYAFLDLSYNSITKPFEYGERSKKIQKAFGYVFGCFGVVVPAMFLKLALNEFRHGLIHRKFIAKDNAKRVLDLIKLKIKFDNNYIIKKL